MCATLPIVFTVICLGFFSWGKSVKSLPVMTACIILYVFGMIFGIPPVVPDEWNMMARSSGPTAGKLSASKINVSLFWMARAKSCSLRGVKCGTGIVALDAWARARCVASSMRALPPLVARRSKMTVTF